MVGNADSSQSPEPVPERTLAEAALPVATALLFSGVVGAAQAASGPAGSAFQRWWVAATGTACVVSLASGAVGIHLVRVVGKLYEQVVDELAAGDDPDQLAIDGLNVRRIALVRRRDRAVKLAALFLAVAVLMLIVWVWVHAASWEPSGPPSITVECSCECTSHSLPPPTQTEPGVVEPEPPISSETRSSCPK